MPEELCLIVCASIFQSFQRDDLASADMADAGLLNGFVVFLQKRPDDLVVFRVVIFLLGQASDRIVDTDAVLGKHYLFIEIHEHGIVSGIDDGLMEADVQVIIFFVVPGVQMLKQRVVIQQYALVKPLLVPDGGSGFQKPADLVGFIDPGLGYGSGESAFAGTDLDQSLLLQGQDGFPDRRSADTGFLHDLSFIDGFAGHVFTHFQLMADVFICPVFQGGGSHILLLSA